VNIWACCSIAVLLPLLLSEFSDWAHWLAVHIVRHAARRLGSGEITARYVEEFVGTVEAVPGKLTKLTAAVSILLVTPLLRRILHTTVRESEDRLFALNRDLEASANRPLQSTATAPTPATRSSDQPSPALNARPKGTL